MGFPRTLAGLLLLGCLLPEPASAQQRGRGFQNWQKIAPYFSPPEEFADDLGNYRSPLLFEDGRRTVERFQDWEERRNEIRRRCIGEIFGDTLDGRCGQRVAERLLALARGGQ